jgi:hypothetical protein
MTVPRNRIALSFAPSTRRLLALLLVGAHLACGSSTTTEETKPHAPEAGPSVSTEGGPSVSTSYGDLANLVPCDGGCASGEVCANAPQPDIGCPTPEDGGPCLAGCPGCPSSAPTCVKAPAKCGAQLGCDCLLQAACGQGDASFTMSAATSACERLPSGEWVYQCGNEI